MLLTKEFYSKEVSSRLSRTIEVSRVAKYALIQILLKLIKHILDTAIELNLHPLANEEGVVQFQIQIKK